jgi:hypothetical protein
VEVPPSRAFAVLASLPALLIARPSAAESPVRVSVGVDGGVALQGDQYVTGPRAGLRATRVPFLELQLATLAGLGADHVTGRTSLRLRPHLELGDVRLSPLAGVALYRYVPRGAFATFCDKADLACSATVVGLEAGLGLGYRWIGVDLVVGTGELPLYTFTGGVTFQL